jgi:hypothetical protein
MENGKELNLKEAKKVLASKQYSDDIHQQVHGPSESGERSERAAHPVRKQQGKAFWIQKLDKLKENQKFEVVVVNLIFQEKNGHLEWSERLLSRFVSNQTKIRLH